MNDVRQDMNRQPAELEQEADRARAAVEHTLEALEHKFSPGQLLDQALHLAKSNGSDFGRNLTTQVRNNPVPLLLTGVGITWLMSASNRPPEHAGSSGGPSTGQRASSAASGAKSAASGAADRTRSAARSTSDSLSETAQSARGAMDSARGAVNSAADSTRSALGNTQAAVGNFAGATRQTAASVASASRGGARSLLDGYDYLRREQPLVLGALAVAAGAALGALMPSTRREDEWLGERSEDATERLKQEGREKAEEAKTAAADAAEAARQTAEQHRTESRA